MSWPPVGHDETWQPPNARGLPAPATADRTPGSFISLVTPYVPVVQRVAAALVGPADAEDAVQEAMIRAWQAAPMLQGIAAPRPWLVRITINVCRDWHRGRFGTRRRLTEVLPAGVDSDAFAVFADDPGTSDHTGALDLRRAVGALERDLRVVVALRYYAALDATEIGAALGVPPATVRTRLRRALGQLRERLAAPGERTSISREEGGRS